MLRIARIALLALVPTLALGALASGCGDDTTTPPVGDMAVKISPDMRPLGGDMAHHD